MPHAREQRTHESTFLGNEGVDRHPRAGHELLRRQYLLRRADMHRCHTIGPRHRFRLCQTQEAHISADGFARDGRRWAPASARRTGQNWARRSKEKQHLQSDLHRASPSVLRVQWTLLVHARLNTSNGTSLNVAGREGLAAVHRRAVSHRKCEPDRAASMLRVFLARTPLPWAKSPPS